MTRQTAAKVIEAVLDAVVDFGRELAVELRAMYSPRLKPAPAPLEAPQGRASYTLAGVLPSIPDPHNVAKCQLCVDFARMNRLPIGLFMPPHTERPIDPREQP